MIRKLEYIGKLFIDGDNGIVIKTEKGNMFTINEISDLQTIEAKDLLIDKPLDNYDDEEEESYKTNFNMLKNNAFLILLSAFISSRMLNTMKSASVSIVVLPVK